VRLNARPLKGSLRRPLHEFARVPVGPTCAPRSLAPSPPLCQGLRSLNEELKHGPCRALFRVQASPFWSQPTDYCLVGPDASGPRPAPPPFFRSVFFFFFFIALRPRAPKPFCLYSIVPRQQNPRRSVIPPHRPSARSRPALGDARPQFTFPRGCRLALSRILPVAPVPPSPNIAHCGHLGRVFPKSPALIDNTSPHASPSIQTTPFAPTVIVPFVPGVRPWALPVRTFLFPA